MGVLERGEKNGEGEKSEWTNRAGLTSRSRNLRFPIPHLTPNRATTARNERKSSSRRLMGCVHEPGRLWSSISCRNVRRRKPRRFWVFPRRPSRHECSTQESPCGECPC